jgi:hypothetical protein
MLSVRLLKSALLQPLTLGRVNLSVRAVERRDDALILWITGLKKVKIHR